VKYFNLFILTIFTFSACNTAKKATTTTTTEKPAPAPTRALTVNDCLTRLGENEIKADWLSGDGNVDYAGKPMNVSASMNIRFKRDSIIWINVKKLGFNVARAKITPDSVFVVNYIQNSYVAKDLKYIETKFNIPADFKVIQNLLLGNPVYLTDSKKLILDRDPVGDILLRGKDERWTALYRIDEKTNELKEMLFEQPSASRKMKISYEKYDILRGYAKGDSKYSYLRTIQVESPQTGKVSVTIEVDTDGLEVNVPKNIKFEIPSHYSRMD
jgi:Domain of unknown function (DUF4292)